MGADLGRRAGAGAPVRQRQGGSLRGTVPARRRIPLNDGEFL